MRIKCIVKGVIDLTLIFLWVFLLVSESLFELSDVCLKLLHRSFTLLNFLTHVLWEKDMNVEYIQFRVILITLINSQVIFKY